MNGPLGDIAEALDRVGSLGGSLRDAADRLVNLIDPVLKPAVPPDNKPCAVPEPTRSPLARALHSRADDLYLVICCLNDAAERVQLHS